MKMALKAFKTKRNSVNLRVSITFSKMKYLQNSVGKINKKLLDYLIIMRMALKASKTKRSSINLRVPITFSKMKYLQNSIRKIINGTINPRIRRVQTNEQTTRIFLPSRWPKSIDVRVDSSRLFQQSYTVTSPPH